MIELKEAFLNLVPVGVFGLLIYLVLRFVPMSEGFKQLIGGASIFLAVLYLLAVFHVVW